MNQIQWKMTFVCQFPGGFSSVLITQSNGREDFWMLSDAVIHGLMERQAAQTNSTTT